LTLPEDVHYQPRQLQTLFTKPHILVRLRGTRAAVAAATAARKGSMAAKSQAATATATSLGDVPVDDNHPQHDDGALVLGFVDAPTSADAPVDAGLQFINDIMNGGGDGASDVSSIAHTDGAVLPSFGQLGDGADDDDDEHDAAGGMIDMSMFDTAAAATAASGSAASTTMSGDTTIAAANAAGVTMMAGNVNASMLVGGPIGEDGPLQLIAQPQRAQRIDIKYARFAKKVDVRALKDCLWRQLKQPKPKVAPPLAIKVYSFSLTLLLSLFLLLLFDIDVIM
jgi:hypothetical protein